MTPIHPSELKKGDLVCIYSRIKDDVSMHEIDNLRFYAWVINKRGKKFKSYTFFLIDRGYFL